MKIIQVKVKRENAEINIKADAGENLLDVLWKNQILVSNPCKGNGTCGKCKVKVLSGELEITGADKRCLREEELQQGIRLACKAVLKEDIRIEIKGFIEEEITVETLSVGENNNGKKEKRIFEERVTKDHNSAKDNELLNRKKEKKAEEYFVAIDIGTTTIAMALADKETGEVFDTYTSINHQRIYGADVISRIEASNNGKQKELKQLIEEDLWKGILELSRSKEEKITDVVGRNKEEIIEFENRKNAQKHRKITRIIIAGNTTMLHLMQGYSCESLGKYPFSSDYLGQKECTLKECIELSGNSIYEDVPITILPGISAFVGADIVADIMSCPGFETGGIHLLIDLGTNGEMVLGNKDGLLVTSVAAGPAFEGGNITHGTASVPGAISQVKIENQRAIIRTIDNKMPPVGICGTGLISAIAQLKKQKLLDEQGNLNYPYDQKDFSLWKNEKGDKVSLYPKDIREFQLAKAALRAGIEILLQEYGCRAEEVSHIYLAGGFGTKVREEEVIETGILPKEFAGKTEAIGNGVLKGMLAFGISKENKKQICNGNVRSISLAEMKEFQEMYIKYVNFVV